MDFRAVVSLVVPLPNYQLDVQSVLKISSTGLSYKAAIMDMYTDKSLSASAQAEARTTVWSASNGPKSHQQWMRIQDHSIAST